MFFSLSSSFCYKFFSVTSKSMPLFYPEIMADACLNPLFFNVNEKFHPELS